MTIRVKDELREDGPATPARRPAKTDLLRRWISGTEDTGNTSFVSLLEDGMGLTDFDIDEKGAVEDFMSVDPVTATPEMPIAQVAQRMILERVHRVIVVPRRVVRDHETTAADDA